MIEALEKTAWHLLAPEFKKHSSFCTRLTFKAGSTIVKNGLLVKKDGYAAVPLAYIESGTVAIIENDRAVKYCRKGECLGLFETAYFLETGVNRRIGRWNVEATTDVELMISSDTFLQATLPTARKALIDAAKYNPVAKPLSNLPLLDWFARTYRIEPRSDVIIAYHGHILPSSYEFIKHLAYIAGPENTFILEKPYSTIPSAYRKVAESGGHTFQLHIDPHMPYDFSIKRGVDYFWHEITAHARATHIKKIVVVSDGADALLSPSIEELRGVEIVGVEQTMRGLRRLLEVNSGLPVISIANSHAKKHYESPFIADAMLRKMESCGLIDPHLRYGVIGGGNIGREIRRSLHSARIRPFVYDIVTKAPTRQAQTLEKLVENSDVIIGTTGRDSLRGMHIQRLKGHKKFISASSSNLEFGYLFDLGRAYSNTFEDVLFSLTDACSAQIVNGGYPINFDRTIEWEAQTDIQLTRALLYAAVFEALTSRPLKHRVAPLAPELEAAVLDAWLNTYRTPAEK
jgi:hypothetical protein